MVVWVTKLHHQEILEAARSLTSQEGQNMMKSMKYLVFKGEDQDHNKDAM